MYLSIFTLTLKMSIILSGATANTALLAGYGAGSGAILLTELMCTGTEDSLVDCPSSTVGPTCTHNLDAGAVCQINCEISHNVMFTRSSYHMYMLASPTWPTLFRASHKESDVI